MGSKVVIGTDAVGRPAPALYHNGKCVAQADFGRISHTPDGRIRIDGFCDFAPIQANGITVKGALTALAQAAYQAELDWKAGRI